MSCVFCELLATGDAQWIARESDAVAFFPLPDSALAPGHTLVVPRRHCVGVLDADEDTLAITMHLVRRVGLAMTRALGAAGIVVLNARGPHSGQSVPRTYTSMLFRVGPTTRRRCGPPTARATRSMATPDGFWRKPWTISAPSNDVGRPRYPGHQAPPLDRRSVRSRILDWARGNSPGADYRLE